MYDRLSAEEAAILIQLRTFKCKLNGYLATIDAATSDLCECGQPETVRHFLIECPRWDTERQGLKQAGGAKWTDLSFLLGGWNDRTNPGGTYIAGPREKWKHDQKVVAATIAFAKSTGRLKRG